MPCIPLRVSSIYPKYESLNFLLNKSPGVLELAREDVEFLTKQKPTLNFLLNKSPVVLKLAREDTRVRI